jgi:hypothetical protein
MTALKYGFTLPFSDPRKVADIARLAEETGWDGLYLGDAIWCMDPMIALTAAAMVTTRLRLGTLVIPAPLRVPYKIASESVALDHLSGGRLTLGLAMGATWMGWHAFPDEIMDTRARAEMLDETIDILTELYQRKPFDYGGKHFHLKLTQMDVMHYPPKPIQQPRIPLWIPAVWPRMKSIQRVLKCDGLLPHKMNAENKFEDVKPADLREMKTYIDANRTLTTPFDYVMEGKTIAMTPLQMQDTLCPWMEAGMTWWVESLWGEPEEKIIERVKQGPPKIE